MDTPSLELFMFCIFKAPQNMAESFILNVHWLVQFRINTLQYFILNPHISHHCKQNKNRNNRPLYKEMISLCYACYLLDIFLHMQHTWLRPHCHQASKWRYCVSHASAGASSRWISKSSFLKHETWDAFYASTLASVSHAVHHSSVAFLSCYFLHTVNVGL